MEKILNYINGEFKAPRSGGFLPGINPALGQAYCSVADSNEEDVAQAVHAANEAFPAWAATPVQTRSRYLRQIAEKIAGNLQALAEAETIDNGKPISLSKNLDIPRSQANLEFFADAALQLQGESFSSRDRGLNYTTYTPLGAVACISPWNLPLYLFTWKIAPALAAGNTVVAKPSEVTPMTAFRLSQIAFEVGLPRGVLNLVHGLGPKVGAPLVTHGGIKAVSFTGSTATGRSIAQSTAGSFKKLALEMGGKNPNIVFADADFDKALDTTVRAAFSNQGQICLCGSRILIQKPVYERFKTALVERATRLRLGDPLMPETEQGALVSQAHMEKVLSYFELARKEGGKVLCGGARAKLSGEFAGGYFIQPTLIEGLDVHCRTNQEEIFGPVATLIPFETEEEAIQMANATRYGLSASLWTENLHRAHRVAALLEAGTVWINTWMLRDLRTPFGGVKESGFGREGGLEGLRFFSEVKNTCLGA